MAEIDQTASKTDNVKNNGSIIANKIGDAMENLPSNESVLHGLNKVKVELDRAKTAPEIDNTGRRILQDAELLVDDMKIMVKERNEGDRMQELARELKLAAEIIAGHSKTVGSAGVSGAQGMDSKSLQNAAKDGFKSIQLAVTEVVRSSEFRGELMEFLRFAADVLRSGIKDSRKEYVAGSKGERKMRRQAGSYAAASSDSPYSGQREGDRDYYLSQDNYGNCKECNSSQGMYQNPSRQQVPAEVTNVKDNAELAVNEQLDKLNLPHRVELSDEQLEELVNRFIDIMRSVTDRPRTREAFLGIMNLIQLFSWELNQNSGRFRGHGKHAASEIRDDDHVRRAIFLAREEIEQFTGGRSVKPFFRHFKQASRIIREDEETRIYFRDLWAFVDRVVEQPESLDKRETADETRNLIKRSRSLKNREVTDHISDALREGRRIIKKITQDPVIQRMRNDFTRLIDDITKDTYGKFTLDGDVWNQLRLILTYSVIERVRIPLPPIESEDEKRQYRVKDVILNLRDFVPQQVTLEDHARMMFDVTDLRHPRMRKTRNIFSLFLKNIHFSVHNADIWFRRKRAPHMETNLKADIEIGPNGKRGLDLLIELVSKPGNPGMFQVRNVTATINNILIHVADVSMAFMYNAVMKIIKSRIAAKLERSIEDGIRKGLEALNRVLVERISDPARKAARQAGDKAGDMDFNDLLRRFGETTMGQQAKRGLHMAKGDSAAGKRDRRHAKKHAKKGVKIGKKKAVDYRDQAGERIQQHNMDKYYDNAQGSTVTNINDLSNNSSSSGSDINIVQMPIQAQQGAIPVQQAGYSSIATDTSNPLHPIRTEHNEMRSQVVDTDGSTISTVIHQEKRTEQPF